MGPSCEFTVTATDRKYTGITCDHYVCIPCSRDGPAASQGRDAASHSTDFPVVSVAAGPVPPRTATAASTTAPRTTATVISDSRVRAYDETWEMARITASQTPRPLQWYLAFYFHLMFLAFRTPSLLDLIPTPTPGTLCKRIPIHMLPSMNPCSF